MEEDLFNAMKSHHGYKIRSFSAKFKLEVIADAKKVKNNSATAKKFKIDPKRVREWLKQEQKLKAQGELSQKGGQRKKLGKPGRKLMSEELELELLNYIESLREKKLRVSRRMIAEKAAEIFNRLKGEGKIAPNKVFKKSRGYVDKFMERNGLVIRRKTTICQKAPSDYVEKLVSFIMHIRRQRKAIKYSHIYASDETSCWFEVIGPTSVEKVGAKEVSIRSTGHEKMRCTVFLTARMDGKKEKPFVVLKRVRRLPDLEKKFPKLIIEYSRNGWMDQQNTEIYLDKVIGSFSFGSRRLLVWDAFRCHIDKATKVKLAKMKIDTAVVPGGCTKFVQPADVSWNKTFKGRMGIFYDEWMVNGEKEFTNAGNPKAPSLETVCSWIQEAWYSIPEKIIIDSFKFCGISSDLSGEEDHMITCLKNEACQFGLDLLKEQTEVINRQENFDVIDLQNYEDPRYREDEQDLEQEEENGVVVEASDEEEEEMLHNSGHESDEEMSGDSDISVEFN